MTDRLCAQGHVVEEYRETCSRCNGAVIKPEAPAQIEGEDSANTRGAAEEGQGPAPKRRGRKPTVKIPKSSVISREEAKAQGIDVEKVEAEAEKSDEVAEIVDDEAVKE